MALGREVDSGFKLSTICCVILEAKPTFAVVVKRRIKARASVYRSAKLDALLCSPGKRLLHVEMNDESPCQSQRKTRVVVG